MAQPAWRLEDIRSGRPLPEWGTDALHSHQLCWVPCAAASSVPPRTWARAEIVTFMRLSLLSRMAEGFLWYLAFPSSMVSVETTGMRGPAFPLQPHREGYTFSLWPRRVEEIGAMARHHRETCAQCLSQLGCSNNIIDGAA